MAEPQRAPSGDARLDLLVVTGVLALALVAVLLGSLAPGPNPTPVKAVVTKPADDPACAEWTDGCRVCQRLAEGPACSLPGIACTVGAQECLRRGTAP